MNGKPEEKPRWKRDDAQDSEDISNMIDHIITESTKDTPVTVTLGVFWAFRWLGTLVLPMEASDSHAPRQSSGKTISRSTGRTQ
jgi:hypothetical protein